MADGEVKDYEEKGIVDGVKTKEKIDPKKALSKNENEVSALKSKIQRLERHLRQYRCDWQAVVELLKAKSELYRQEQLSKTIQYQIEIEKYRNVVKKRSSGSKTSGSSGNAKLDKVVQWFDDHKGKITYSMAGSRNGSDGTGDCSGCISQALKDAGFNIQGLPSTVTLGGQLQTNGFVRIAVNQKWQPKKGDIVLMSRGASMTDSGGASGHVGVMKSSTTFISCDYSTGGQAGTAVSEHEIFGYLSSRSITYYEVWRLQ